MVKVVLDTSTGMDLTQDDDTFEVVKDGEVMLGGQFVGEDAAREAFDKLTLSVEGYCRTLRAKLCLQHESAVVVLVHHGRFAVGTDDRLEGTGPVYGVNAIGA